jgi:hypothetical protein
MIFVYLLQLPMASIVYPHEPHTILSTPSAVISPVFWGRVYSIRICILL